MMWVNVIISAVVQLLLFSLIPFGYWTLLRRKTNPSFFQWIGLRKPEITQKRKFAAWFVGSALVLCGPGFVMTAFVLDGSDLASSQFYGAGLPALFPALVYSFLQTGLSEEVLFRGFLGKGLIRRFGFAWGNGIQAFLFGLLHAVMLAGPAGIIKAFAVFILTAFAGWCLGFMNEKLSGGCILPSWILHGLVNLLSCFYMMFT
ncbi:CPBP family intramembrane glutamic endopeptidase [Paenibacillus sp. CAU 1782]